MLFFRPGIGDNPPNFIILEEITELRAQVNSCITSLTEVQLEGVINISDSDLQELNNYIDTNILSCLNNFTIIKEQGFEVTAGEAKTNSILKEDNIIISAKYPISLIKENIETHLQSFQVELEI